MFKSQRYNLVAIVLFVGSLVALISYLSFLSLESSKQLAVDEYSQKQLIIAERGASSLQLYLDSLTRETIAISKADIIKEFKEGESRTEISRRLIELRSLGVMEIKIIDSEGDVVYAAADHDLEGKNINKENIFSDSGSSLKSEYIYVVEINDDGRDDTKILTISSPIYTESSYAGSVSLDLSFDNLSKNQLNTLESAISGHAILFDNDFQILWAHDIGEINSGVGKGIKKFDGELREMTSGKSQLLELIGVDIHSSHNVGTKSDKIDSLVAVSPVKLGNMTWFLTIGAPKDEALQLMTDVVKNILFMVAIIISAILGATAIFIVHLLKAGIRLEQEVESRTKEVRESEDNFRRIAEILQEALITPIPQFPSLNIAVGYKPAHRPERVGGDFYDVFQVADDKIALLIGDVAGRGVEAAGFTESIRSTIRAHATVDYSPAYVLGKTSESLIGRVKHFEYATSLFAILDAGDKSLTVASAGHPPLIVFDEKAQNVMANTGTPFGYMKGKYEETKLYLNEQTGILLYTDGLLEARNDRDFFGEQRVWDILEDNLNMSSQDLVNTILSEVNDFADGSVDDDIALVVIRFVTEKIGQDRNLPLEFPLVRERIET